jgi:predicted ATP-dependent serine protease
MATKDIEQRLKTLEIEQEQQQVVLETSLSNFHEELRRLEETLATIDSYIMGQVENTYERKVLSETERMEIALKEMEKKEHQRFGKIPPVKEKIK